MSSLLDDDLRPLRLLSSRTELTFDSADNLSSSSVEELRLFLDTLRVLEDPIGVTLTDGGDRGDLYFEASGEDIEEPPVVDSSARYGERSEFRLLMIGCCCCCCWEFIVSTLFLLLGEELEVEFNFNTSGEFDLLLLKDVGIDACVLPVFVCFNLPEVSDEELDMEELEVLWCMNSDRCSDLSLVMASLLALSNAFKFL